MKRWFYSLNRSYRQYEVERQLMQQRHLAERMGMKLYRRLMGEKLNLPHQVTDV